MPKQCSVESASETATRHIAVERRSGVDSATNRHLRTDQPRENMASEPPYQGVPAVSAPLDQGRDVLLVDDDPDTRTSMAMLLQFWGREARVAPDAVTALEMVRHALPRVLLLDLGLPHRDGFGLLEDLRSQVPGFQEKVTIIVISGRCDDACRRRAEQAGLYLFFKKPADLNLIEQLVKQALGGLDSAPALTGDHHGKTPSSI